MVTVWAFKKLKELDERTGFVQVNIKTAEKLISSGKVQDPKVGNRALKFIDDTPIKKVPVRKTPVKKSPTKAKDESTKKA